MQFLGFQPHIIVRFVARLAAFFIAGALLYRYRERVRLSRGELGPQFFLYWGLARSARSTCLARYRVPT